MTTIRYTVFPDQYAQKKKECESDWPTLCALLSGPASYDSKTLAPFIKLATFGDSRSVHGCLRTNANLIEVTGIEGDYDAEQVTPEEAVARLEAAGIRAVVYTSGSHRSDAPRWRVLTPLSRAYSKDARHALLARLNGALGGILAAESFTLSQSFYFGRINGAEYHCFVTFNDSDAGSCLDELDELDNIAIGKREKAESELLAPSAHKTAWQDAAALVEQYGRLLLEGDGRRDLLKSYIASRSSRGLQRDEIRSLCETFAEMYFDPDDPMDEENIGKIIEHFTTKDASIAAQREAFRSIGEGDSFSPLPEVLTTEQMVDRFVFLADGSRVFDTHFPAHTLPVADFRNMTAASSTEVPVGGFFNDGRPKTRRIFNADLWLRREGRKSAVSATFKAGDGLYVNDPNGRNCVNLWNGFKHSEGNADDAALFFAHVNWLFGDRADDFLDWLAHIVQRPGELPHTAWLHISSHTGTGRNAMAAILALVFAGYAALSLDLAHILESGFNERLSRKLIAVVDEIREGGAGQWKHAEALKQALTAPVRNINTKYGRQTMEHNACRFLLFSNHRSAIPLDDTDRRIEVVICDQPPQSADYYARLYAAINDLNFVAGVAALLLKRDLSKFNPGRHARRTSAKEQVITTSRSAELSNLLEFNDNYPFELATAKRLQIAMDIRTTFAPEARKISHTLQDGGWEKLERRKFNSCREVIYVRRQYYGKWEPKSADVAQQIPKIDGGNADWCGVDELFGMG